MVARSTGEASSKDRGYLGCCVGHQNKHLLQDGHWAHIRFGRWFAILVKATDAALCGAIRPVQSRSGKHLGWLGKGFLLLLHVM